MAIRWSRWSPQVALMPAVIVAAVCFVGAIGWTVLLSFTGSRRFPDYEFEGLRQFERLFDDRNWLTSLSNIAILGVGSALAIVFGFVLAAMIDRETRGEGGVPDPRTQLGNVHAG